MYKLTKSIDREERVTVSVSFRLSLRDIATMVVCDEQFDAMRMRDSGEISTFVMIYASTKRQVIKATKRALENYGSETPYYKVGDADLHDVVAAVEQRLNQIWSPAPVTN